ncbi:MAG: esterase/lipase family protein [Nitriliruptoraceae bacterium]
MAQGVGTDAAAWSRLVAAVAEQVVVGAVEDIHRAASDGAYRWLGPLGRPVQRSTDAATDAAYRAVRSGLRGTGEVVAAACHLGARVAAAPTPAAPSPSRAATKARAIAQGALASELLAVTPSFEEDLSLRHPGRSGPLDPAQLASAVPTASSRLVVFVHGLVDTEQVWFPSDAQTATLPAAVEASGATPLFVRYATGRPIERNGRDLDAALEAVVASWPVPITSLTLVGHSMGGLLLRAACAAAVDRGARWLERLDDLVYLGTPHLGSWLEKVANVTSWTLRRTSRHAAPIGALLDRRSQGIKDLRYGTTEEAAWPEGLVDGLLTGRPVDAAWLGGVRHHLVVGRLHADPGHPLNAVLGDALVRASSAMGAGRWRRIGGATSTRVTAVDASHVGLPRDTEVAAVLREVLAAGRRAA